MRILFNCLCVLILSACGGGGSSSSGNNNNAPPPTVIPSSPIPTTPDTSILPVIVYSKPANIQTQTFTQLSNLNYVSSTVDATGATVQADYGTDCPSKPVLMQLFISANASFDYQGQCFLNARTDANLPGYGFCGLKSPRKINTANTTLVRLWKMTKDCSKYSFEDGITDSSAYQDIWLNSDIVRDRYYALDNNTRIIVDKPNYSVGLDGHGGATYEIYNKQASFNGKQWLSNAIFPNVGAALQFVIQDHENDWGIAPNSSCDISQGFYNPTQAGSFCTSDSLLWGNSPSLLKDGIWPTKPDLNNQLIFPTFLMLNWDYSTGIDPKFRGPAVTFPTDNFKELDSTAMQQVTTLHDSYIEYDIAFENLKLDAPLRPHAFLEFPTAYLTGSFRKWTVKHADSNVISTWIIPDKIKDTPLNPRTEVGLTFNQTGQLYFNQDYITNNKSVITNDVFWITFENVRNVINDSYTIAWFYSKEFRDDISAPFYSYTISETDVLRMIKFSNTPTFNFINGKYYKLKYIIFPFKWNETLPGTNTTVEQKICEIKMAYESVAQSACRL